jgi:AraC-like DNA-binding protein
MRADYVERPAEADLAAELACTWTVTLDAAGLSLLPDGCLDLLWIDPGRLVICGPETAAWRTSLPAGTTAVGVRFRPGVAPAVLGMPVSPLRELRVGMQDVWGAGASHLSERLGEAPDPGARVGILQAAVRARLADGPPVDRVARAVARRLVAPPPGARGGVAGLAADLGYSERQLHRRSVAAFGYGPAVLARILRLQRFLALARSGAGPVGVAALAAAAGYADGPHLARECRALAGATPSELVARETSDPFTTASDPPGTLAAPTS